MSKERVLITGGAGYLGSVITKHLLHEGFPVTCLDRLEYGPQSIFANASDGNFNFVFGDVRDTDLLEKVVPKADVIIPLAAVVGAPACKENPFDAKSINYRAIVDLDRIRSKNQRVIYPTTNSGYGTKSGTTFCTEETPLEPISLYGVTKVDAEKHFLESDKDAITLRLATVFGLSPRMRTDLLVNDFVLRAKRDGSIVIFEKDFVRNYIHVRDVARCFEHCINNFELMKGRPYNVGLEDANLSKAELAEKIREQVPNFKILYSDIGEDPDKRNYRVSNERIMATGFRPSFSLDDGIRELIRGYEMLLRGDPTKNV